MSVGSPAGITRRQFGAMTAGSLAAAASSTVLGQTSTSPAPEAVLDIASWSYYWYGIERVKLARGTMINGMQMFVEHWIPTVVRHPHSIVLVHGGYGQASDWMSTPDGRPGWAPLFLEQGYRVYLVDRPGQGRNPHHPWVHGQYDAQAPTFERVASTIGATGADHTQWPGRGDATDPAIAQVTASMGQPLAINAITLDLWRSRGTLLLDDIGPSIVVTHGDGASFAWVTAEARPELVKGIVAVEQPPNSLRGRQLSLFTPIPIAIVAAEASKTNDPSAAAVLRTAGGSVELILLAERGIRGNGPMVMLERNNREALQPILVWMREKVEAKPARTVATPRSDDPPVIANADSARNTE